MERTHVTILICGGRDFDDWGLFTSTMIDVCNQHTSAHNRPLIISGGARGADKFAIDLAKGWNYQYKIFMAEWDRYGNRAGPIRNQRMLDEGKPDLVVAFPTPTSRGTWDMVRRAQKNNIETIVINGPIAKDFV